MTYPARILIGFILVTAIYFIVREKSPESQTRAANGTVPTDFRSLSCIDAS